MLFPNCNVRVDTNRQCPSHMTMHDKPSCNTVLGHRKLQRTRKDWSCAIGLIFARTKTGAFLLQGGDHFYKRFLSWPCSLAFSPYDCKKPVDGFIEFCYIQACRCRESSLYRDYFVCNQSWSYWAGRVVLMALDDLAPTQRKWKPSLRHRRIPLRSDPAFSLTKILFSKLLLLKSRALSGLNRWTIWKPSRLLHGSIRQ